MNCVKLLVSWFVQLKEIYDLLITAGFKVCTDKGNV